MFFSVWQSGIFSALSLPHFSPSAETSERVYYAPDDNLERIDLLQLNTLLTAGDDSRHLDIAMYSFTDQILGQQIVKLADAGYTIRIYRDGTQYEEEMQRGSAIQKMFSGNSRIHLRVKPPSRSTLMHLKAYSDGTFVREGSANWSPAGEKRQDNSLLIIRNQREVTEFEHIFEAMWDRTDNNVIQ